MDAAEGQSPGDGKANHARADYDGLDLEHLQLRTMGYLRARDSLQDAIYNQLTNARKSKARQVETYFRTLRNELGHLASTQMAIDAAHGNDDHPP